MHGARQRRAWRLPARLASMTPPASAAAPAPDHAELTGVLRTLRLGIDASDLHGSLSGYLCAGTAPTAGQWLECLELSPDSPAVAADPRLQAFFRACKAQFEPPLAEVEPLLPAATEPMPRRAAALVEWCRGFLGGFGLGGAALIPALPADAREILGDFGTIAASSLEGAGGAEDERALADVLEFVRTAAALLHRDALATRRATTPSLH
jgi:uncharacterized protein YgfB (UPF0149 family)